MCFLQHIRTGWSDHFEGYPTTTLGPQQYTSRQNPSVTNVYVSNCLFNACSSSGNGGALYCTSVTCLLIESSSFFSCKTSSSNGGAIYFSNTNDGECVLYKACGNDCSSTYTSGYPDSQFAYLYVKNAASSKNYVNYSSIARCINEISKSRYVIRIHYGRICFPSVNFSMNKCGWRSAMYCLPFSDSNSVTCSLLYSIFTDNIASSYNCIRFLKSNANHEIKFCNVIRNTQGSLSTEATIYTPGNLLIEDSCILENVADYIFYASSKTITLSKCTVDKTTSCGGFIIQNTVTKSFVLALNHVSTKHCSAEYDSAGYLTPVIQPSSSSTKTLYYCTFKRNFCQPHLSDLVSLMWVFMFNTIHPCCSVGL
jgi:hypothetical protein